MAHFAQLDENNVVVQVIVVSDEDTSDENGIEKEEVGIAFCQNLFGGTWKQTSYNNKIRKNYAGIGMIYRPDIDAFIGPQPFPSWTLNVETAHWEPPVPKPNDGMWYEWMEDTQSWQLIGEI